MDDLTWCEVRNRYWKPDPLWKHWYSLHASMSEDWVAGTINDLRDP